MPQIRNFFLFGSILLLAVTLIGCGSGDQQIDDSGVGLANPASVYCQGLGFSEETRESELGQYGVCLFPDGSECDTWDFLAGRCGQDHSYCVSQGYQLEAQKDLSIANCVFDDGSSCSELLYFQGECSPGDSNP
jgi:putative hemolysin